MKAINERSIVRKIALEEHFDAPMIAREDYDGPVFARFPAEMKSRARAVAADLDSGRIAAMDAAGIDLMVLSQTAPGVQIEADAAKALRLAREANDYLAERIQRYPTRFAGFAHLALQDATAGADELERCVTELGFVGAMINGHTNGTYLDEEQFAPFWERVVALDVPVYLHPANPYEAPHVFRGRPELDAATWMWNCETSTHALRLVFAETFDRFPATLILGHMGETIPFYLWRLDSRARIFAPNLKRRPSEIIREHIVITTAGVCADAPLRCSVSDLGIDNVLFSVDYPYEDAKGAVDWIDQAQLTEEEHKKICHENAERILKIGIVA